MFSGLLESGQLYLTFDEEPHEGMRLGRNMWLDGRSLSYMVENDVQEMGKSLRSCQWERVLTVLDQGQLGSCTGNAGTGALGTQPFYDAVGSKVLPAPGDEAAAEAFAVQLYSDATVVDGSPGTYPPDDTGSSGLAICKVLKNRGTISGYGFARTAYGFLRLLQNGPVLQGMPWYKAFFQPDAQGFIDSDPNWASSGVAGGHEVEAVGVELDTSDAFSSVITYWNSWGSNWGDSGQFRMRLRTYEQLNGVDLKQYRV
ncbi:MAG TPA: C1 family peptidase [Streptosporangiaceae bacterium]|nr:C1 family peptidase [Streptosporangiaceae bacterium]